MSQLFNARYGREYSRKLSGHFTELAALSITFLVSSASAQVTHVTNPYAGATVYASPDYTAEVRTAVATEPAGSELANQNGCSGKYPDIRLAGPHRSHCRWFGEQRSSWPPGTHQRGACPAELALYRL
jgi:hypothetical protein